MSLKSSSQFHTVVSPLPPDCIYADRMFDILGSFWTPPISIQTPGQDALAFRMKVPQLRLLSNAHLPRSFLALLTWLCPQFPSHQWHHPLCQVLITSDTFMLLCCTHCHRLGLEKSPSSHCPMYLLVFKTWAQILPPLWSLVLQVHFLANVSVPW